ncbi:MAG: glycoside hydrolase family 127 protein [Clostridiales bacterium]|nr:glycoside hydrolase family 127 protein [Clostridiales bacterium]
MKNISFDNVNLNSGFWAEKQKLIREVSMKNVCKRFEETGRFEGTKLSWKEGQPNKPHVYYDSDIAKWIESVAYILTKHDAPELREYASNVIDAIVSSQDEDGYYNQYYQIFEKDKRFTDRNAHELYCLGHLIEAAVAWYNALGEDKLLRAVEKYVDYVIKCFITDKTAKFASPGHEEIELALVKLYDLTKEKKYLDLALHFINIRGTAEDPGGYINIQAHIPVREQRTAEGHSVRAVYLYSAMADLALRTGDESLKETCLDIYRNITTKRMYITGGIGSSASGEMFSYDYDLPNIHAYAESCANLGLALFCRRLNLLDESSDYADTIERVIYNGFLSSVSLDGKSFFYENPLEIDPALLQRRGEQYPITQRLEVFGCSCCPPNITRFISSIGDFIYNVDGNRVYINQFISNSAEFDFMGEKAEISMESGFPYDGKVKIVWNGPEAEIMIRLPSWCDNYKADEKGYIRRTVQNGDVLCFDFEMKTVMYEADPRVRENAGRFALTRGPLIFCLEGVDNGSYLKDISVKSDGDIIMGYDKNLDLPVMIVDGYRRKHTDREKLYQPVTDDYINLKLKFIPYFAFANRGETEMLIWTQIRRECK